MPVGSRRRWFRFSLRSMFVAATLLCLWLGWELSVLRARQTVRRELKGNAAFHFVSVEAMAAQMVVPVGSPPASVPLVRRWLGDEAIDQIWYTRHLQGFSEADLQRLEKAFPEAELFESLPEPCHPGCFPRGTVVTTPEGPRLIQTIRVGEVVTTVLPTGKAGTAPVQSIFRTDNRLWQVETEAGVLVTTATQPICLRGGGVTPASELQAGDIVIRVGDATVTVAKVISVTATDRTECVYNVVLGDSQDFVAGGFVVRSKPPAER